MWNLSVDGQGMELTPRLRANAHGLIAAALGSSAGDVRDVYVRLQRGCAHEKAAHCEIRIELRRGGGFTIVESGSDPERAILEAASRLARMTVHDASAECDALT